MDKRFIQNTLEDLLNINLRVEYTEYESQEDNDRIKEEKKIFSKIMSRLEKYIHDRKTITGTIYDWEDEEDGKSYTFNTPSDLFDYITYTYKS